jgi:hypothetical protein
MRGCGGNLADNVAFISAPDEDEEEERRRGGEGGGSGGLD